MPYFRRDGAQIYFETQGSGFPLLLLPPGGMNATIEAWQLSAFSPVEIFSREYWTVTLDQRNAGRSTAPLDMEDPWGSYADDQLYLMSHLGCERFLVLGCCMGGSSVLKLMERAPHRVVAGVLEQPIGISDENREALKDNLSLRWATGLAKRRPELNEADIHKFRDRMFNPEGNFVYSVTREFVSSCTTPMLVMPGNIGNLDHPNAIGREIAALAPKSEILEDWRYPADVVPGTVAHIRRFLKAHTPS